MLRVHQTKIASGQIFGRLTASHEATPELKKTLKYAFYWWCVCRCGVIKRIDERSLTRGLTKSCGCIKADLLRSYDKKLTTHGKSKTREYHIWANIKERCLNPNNSRYMDYGGRGITVSDSWMTFNNFIADMGDRPTPKHSIDRKNNDQGYSKENCKWSTKSEQAFNRRSKKS